LITRSFATGAVLLALACPAMAQSSVTLYGIIDDGITYINNDQGKSLLAMKDGINRVNRVGFEGQEDLGGGTKALFKLESGFSANTGALDGGLMFGNSAYVGLDDSRLGRVTLGRQFDFSVLLEHYLPCLECGIYIVENADLDRVSGEWLNDSVQYMSPDIGGLKLGAMYAFPQSGAGATNEGRAYSFSAQYTHGPFGMIATATDINGALVYAGLLGAPSFLGISHPPVVLPIDNQRILALGASYQFGLLHATALYTNTRVTLGEIASTDQVLHVGGDYQPSPLWTLSAAVVADRFEDWRWYSLDTGVSYQLSRRTTAYVDGVFQRATGAGAVASIALAALSSTNSQVVARVGITHTF
jgi:outer membrane protein OmpU